MMQKLGRFILAILAVWMVVCSVQADQYWDSSPTAGFQPGDGYWSTAASDTNWNNGAGNGGQSTWVNDGGSAPFFPMNGGTSRVTISSSCITGNYLRVTGANYTIVQTNGGQLNCLYTGGNVFQIEASNNTWIVAGGSSSVTSILKTVRGGGSIYVGSLSALSSNDVLTVDGGGVTNSAMVSNMGPGATYIGYIAGSLACGVNVVNGGYWYGGDINVGYPGATNHYLNVDNGTVQMIGSLNIWGTAGRGVVKNGSRLNTGGGGSLQVGFNGSSSNCSLTVDGGVVSTLGSQGTHLFGYSSTLTITNGGLVTNGAGGGIVSVIGDTGSTNCTLIVAGGSSTQSVWYLAGSTLTIGSTASSVGNVLRIDGAGSPGSAGVKNTGASQNCGRFSKTTSGERVFL